jgi:hypothetical protein
MRVSRRARKIAIVDKCRPHAAGAEIYRKTKLFRIQHHATLLGNVQQRIAVPVRRVIGRCGVDYGEDRIVGGASVGAPSIGRLNARGARACCSTRLARRIQRRDILIDNVVIRLVAARRFAKIFERIKVQDGQTLSPVF